jgi:hypothetical protein
VITIRPQFERTFQFARGVIVTTLKPETFREIGKVGEARAKDLLTLVKQALTNLAFDPYTQVNDKRVMYHPITPKSL